MNLLSAVFFAFIKVLDKMEALAGRFAARFALSEEEKFEVV